jgi:hypothetical protein
MTIHKIISSGDPEYDELDFSGGEFSYGYIYFLPDGVGFSCIKYYDQTIEYNREDRHSHTYTFNPSGVKLILHNIGTIEVTTSAFSMVENLNEEEDGPDPAMAAKLIAILANIMKIQEAKRKGRNLTSVARIGLSRGLPENVEGEIGEMLSGKRGHLVSQMNQLRQEMGESLAPRVRARARGGKRTTRKRR